MIRLCAFADEAGNALSAQIAALQQNHISLIELRNLNGKNVAALTDAEADAAYEALSAAGIAVWSVGSPLGKVKLAEAAAHMKTVRRVCEIAVRLHAKRIRAFSFFEAEGQGEAVRSALAEMVAIAAEYGLTICHENEKDIYGDTLSRVLEIASWNIKDLAFVFDPANYIQCGVDTKEALAALFDKTYYFHIKDVDAKTGQLVPAGYGDGHIDEMVRSIKAAARDAVLTLEPHLKVFDGYTAIDSTEMQTKFTYATNEESFAAAAAAMKAILVAAGYKEETVKGEYVWQTE